MFHPPRQRRANVRKKKKKHQDVYSKLFLFLWWREVLHFRVWRSCQSSSVWGGINKDHLWRYPAGGKEKQHQASFLRRHSQCFQQWNHIKNTHRRHHFCMSFPFLQNSQGSPKANLINNYLRTKAAISKRRICSRSFGAARRTWLRMSLVGTVSGAFEVTQAVDVVLWSQPRGSVVTVSLFTHWGNW